MAVVMLEQALKDTLVLVLAGGKGTRLKEITANRSKPAVEFAGHCRLIDFPLSNCVNSGLRHIAVLTQYKAQTLIRHLMQYWSPLNQSFGGRLDILPASQQLNEDWYSGTADACYQNIDYIRAFAPKYIMVLSSDHVYQMDYRRVMQSHLQNHADVTVSCIEVATEKAASRFGVLNINQQGFVSDFAEKPQCPKALRDTPGYCLASMGNYLFDSEVFFKLLQQDELIAGSKHDFGGDIIPRAITRFGVYAHRFRDKHGDNIQYWRDVGCLDSYWQANMDLLNDPVQLRLDDPDWPIWGQQLSHSPVSIIKGGGNNQSELQNTIIGQGCYLLDCSIRNSLLSSRCHVKQGAFVQNSVLLPNVQVGANATINNCIVNSDCCIPANFVVNDSKLAKNKGFSVSAGGITLITQEAIDRVMLSKKIHTPAQKVATNLVSGEWNPREEPGLHNVANLFMQ
ncbi:MAG: glucose-1-phosphate adenylyltransferase [Aestuariibacter sp.]